MTVWRFDDALKLTRSISEGVKRFGYNVALGGAVLTTGENDAGVDLYIIPRIDAKKADENKVNQLVEWLKEYWGIPSDLLDTPPKPPVIKKSWGNDELFVYEPFPPKWTTVELNPDGQIINGIEEKPLFRRVLRFNRSSGDRINVCIL